MSTVLCLNPCQGQIHCKIPLPAFYYYRPISIFAAHGYGPVMLAGAEMIELLKKHFPKLNDSAIQFYSKEVKTNGAIFDAK